MCGCGSLERDGFSILSGVLARPEIERLIEAVSTVGEKNGVRSRGGVYAIRNLLHLSPEIRAFAHSDCLRTLIGDHVGEEALAVRATLFDKTAGANWLVPWHQDLTICVADRVDVPGYGPWTKKAGVWHVQPRAAVLEQMLSVRIHLDDCLENAGPLRVLPGTHRLGRLTAAQIAEQGAIASVSCLVRAGGIVLMRPLLVHASSSASEAAHRRVIHIDYAASELDGGLRWVADPG
jgi:ectoine hydroxylase-related dioxygenase (phytanoyl-CoA dioxygenase family)